MKKALSFALVLLLALAALPALAAGFTTETIETLDMSVPFESDYGPLTIESINETPLFAPADMTDGQRAIEITLVVPLAYAEAAETVSADFFVIGKAGLFTPGAVTQMDGDDGTARLGLLIAIPRESAVADFRLVFNDQARSLGE